MEVNKSEAARKGLVHRIAIGSAGPRVCRPWIARARLLSSGLWELLRVSSSAGSASVSARPAVYGFPDCTRPLGLGLSRTRMRTDRRRALRQRLQSNALTLPHIRIFPHPI